MPVLYSQNYCQFREYKKAGGLTLLELLFTLAIFSIVIASGVPLLSDTVSRFNGDSALRNFRNLVSYARAEAIVRRKDVVICPRAQGTLTCHSAGMADSDEESQVWQQGWLLFVDNGDSPTSIDNSDGDVLLKSVDPVGQSVAMIMGGSTGGGNLGYIRFMSRGNSYPTNLSALFCIRENGRVIYGGKIVIARGRVRLEDSSTARAECTV